MAVEGLRHWALVNGYSATEADYNITQWHKLDKAVFEGVYEHLLELAEPRCYDCPSIGAIAIEAIKKGKTSGDAESELRELQIDCRGSGIFEEVDPIDGQQAFITCSNYPKYSEMIRNRQG